MLLYLVPKLILFLIYRISEFKNTRNLYCLCVFPDLSGWDHFHQFPTHVSHSQTATSVTPPSSVKLRRERVLEADLTRGALSSTMKKWKVMTSTMMWVMTGMVGWGLPLVPLVGTGQCHILPLLCKTANGEGQKATFHPSRPFIINVLLNCFANQS